VRKGYVAGAKAFLSKHTTVEEIYTAICQVNTGAHYVPPDIGTLVLEWWLKHEADKKAADHSIIIYTKQQLEIIKGAHVHKTYAQIGKEIHKSKRTVEDYCSQMFHDLGVKNFKEVIAYAIKTGQLK
jgi:DNA-binding NarL/FixJ family response regulator